MPIQSRLVPLLLVGLLSVGCAGDDATPPAPDESVADTPAAPPVELEPVAKVATGAAAAAGDSAATAATAGGGAALGAGAARQDEPLEVCWSESKSADAASYKLAGDIRPAPGRRPDVDQLVLIATDAPISEWMNGVVVPVFAAASAMLGNFELEVKDAPKSLYLCAFAPATFDDNQSFAVAGCTAAPVTGKAGASSTSTGIELVVYSRNNPVLTLGGARFGDEAWTRGRVKRTVSGTVTGVKAEGYVIATAPTPILEEEESTSEPLGMAVAGADGAFSLSYFAAPKDPLFVCAMAFDDAAAPSALTGTGCVSVKIPEVGGAAAREFRDVEVELSAESEELAADDASHIALLQNCLGAK
jgi:hypothetical protein